MKLTALAVFLLALGIVLGLALRGTAKGGILSRVRTSAAATRRCLASKRFRATTKTYSPSRAHMRRRRWQRGMAQAQALQDDGREAC